MERKKREKEIAERDQGRKRRKPKVVKIRFGMKRNGEKIP